MSDPTIYEPYIRALLGIASHFHEALLLKFRAVPLGTVLNLRVLRVIRRGAQAMYKRVKAKDLKTALQVTSIDENPFFSKLGSPQPSTFNPQPSTLNPQPSTRNPQPSTLNAQPSTLNPQPSTKPGASPRGGEREDSTASQGVTRQMRGAYQGARSTAVCSLVAASVVKEPTLIAVVGF